MMAARTGPSDPGEGGGDEAARAKQGLPVHRALVAVDAQVARPARAERKIVAPALEHG